MWHEGLLYKLKKCLPNNHYQSLKSFITGKYSELNPIQAGVTQGNVLRPFVYFVYTADLSKTLEVINAVLASYENPEIAADILQGQLVDMQKWLETRK